MEGSGGWVEELGPAGAEAMGGFFVGHVGEVWVGVVCGVGEVACEAWAGAFGEEGILGAEGEEGGVGDFLEGGEVEGGGEVGGVGGEVADHFHEAEAVFALGHIVEVVVAEFGVEAGFVDVADVFDAGEEFFGGGEGHEEFAEEGDAGEAVHLGEGLGVTGGVGEEEAFEAGVVGAFEGGDEGEAAAEGVSGEGEVLGVECVGDFPRDEGEGFEGDAAVGPVGGGEGGVIDEGEVVGGEEVGGDAAEGGDGEAHAVEEDEEGARGRWGFGRRV